MAPPSTSTGPGPQTAAESHPSRHAADNNASVPRDACELEPDVSSAERDTCCWVPDILRNSLELLPQSTETELANEVTIGIDWSALMGGCRVRWVPTSLSG